MEMENILIEIPFNKFAGNLQILYLIKNLYKISLNFNKEGN